jgi:hypothetical protein
VGKEPHFDAGQDRQRTPKGSGVEDRIVARVQALINQRHREAWETRTELAQRLKISLDTLDRRAAAGDEIEIRRVGRRVLVRLRERLPDEEIAAAAADAPGAR